MMNYSSPSRTIFSKMPIALTYISVDRKSYRDQYCIECGHPFIAISDKFVTIDDGGVPIEQLRKQDKVLEARCKNHYCKQYYRIVA